VIRSGSRPIRSDSVFASPARACSNAIVVFAMVLLLPGARASAFPLPSIGPTVSCVDTGNGPGLTPNSVIQGNVVVPPRSGCTLTNVVISGNVTVQSGANYLNALGAHVKGDLLDFGGTTISLGTLDGTIFPGWNYACPSSYSFDPNNGLCEFDDLDAVGSKTIIGGNFEAFGGDLSFDGVDIAGNLQAYGVNSITTIPPVACGDDEDEIFVNQTAIAIINSLAVFSIQSLVCTGGILQIVADDNGLFEFLPGRPVNIGGSVAIFGTAGVPPNSLTNAICNAEIGQNLALDRNRTTAPFVLGAAFADSSYLNGLPFSPCVPNTIVGNTSISQNNAAVTGVGNVFLGNLTCQGNTPAPSGSANIVVGQRQSQCQSASVF
jgi:hypothetical protein